MGRIKSKKRFSKDGPVRVLQFVPISEMLWFLLTLIKELQDKGFKVMAAARRSEFGPDAQLYGFELFDLPVTRRLNPFAIIRGIYATAALLRKQSIDIIHVHSCIGGVIGRLAAWLAGTPVIIYMPHGWHYMPETPMLVKNIVVLAERILSKITDHFFIISQEEFQIGLSDKILNRQNCTITLGVGIDCDKFDPCVVPAAQRQKLRQEFNIPPEATVISFVGRLIEEKGLLVLGEAFSRLYKENTNLRLLIVGSADVSGRDTTCLDRFLSQLKSYGCDNAVIFAGQRDDVRDILAISSIFALPTFFCEGMPVSLLEAMAMELPCVATDSRGCREEIIDGQSGYLIPARQVEPLYHRLKDFLQDTESAKRMGQAARRRVIEIFSVKKVLEIQLASYNRFRETLNQKQ